MFAEVILHRRVPAKLDSFTYEVPQDFALNEGQIVTVPFRNQRLSGIVRKLHNQKPNYKTKLIETVASLVLPPKQMEFAVWMSEHYKCSFSKAIDLFIPEKIWSPSKKTAPKPAQDSTQKTVTQMKIPDLKLQNLIKELKVVPPSQDINCLTSSRLAGLGLLFEKTPLPREDFYSELINSTPKDSQTLFIFPEIFYAQKFGMGAEQFHSGLNETCKAEVWENARTGVTKAIFGTRASLFLPFKNLSLIVVDYEHNESYNEKRQPNYNAVEVAEHLAKIWNIPLIIISSTPRVETWHRNRNIVWEENEKSAPITILDMADERRKGNLSVFAEKTTQRIAANLAQDKQILLFINRKGESSATLCTDCGEVFKCEKCNGILTLHEENWLKCHKCKIQKQMPNKCDKCDSVNLKSIGSGTEKIEKEIKKIFGKASVLRLDQETAVKIPDAKTLNKADILIATQIIDKPLDLPRLKLSVALTPDFLLNMPDFRATERVFQLLTHIRHMTSNGEMIIQTLLPENPIFKYLQQNTPEKFYEDELATRKMLNLPPFNSPLN